MDNTRDIPGYKYYVDEATGDRPAVYVAFLDLEPDPNSAVNGIVFPADRDKLAGLDARERSYRRREVDIDIDSRVWAYFGRSEARERARGNRAVVQRSYYDSVRDGFEELGGDQLGRFEQSTDTPRRLASLRRIELQ